VDYLFSDRESIKKKTLKKRKISKSLRRYIPIEKRKREQKESGVEKGQGRGGSDRASVGGRQSQEPRGGRQLPDDGDARDEKAKRERGGESNNAPRRPQAELVAEHPSPWPPPPSFFPPSYTRSPSPVHGQQQQQHQTKFHSLVSLPVGLVVVSPGSGRKVNLPAASRPRPSVCLSPS